MINNGTTPKPGYKPYTYPHPLVSGASNQNSGGPTTDRGGHRTEDEDGMAEIRGRTAEDRYHFLLSYVNAD